MARHLDLIVERRRCLERRCDQQRAQLVDAIHELHEHWLPVERVIGRVKHFAAPSVLLGGLSLPWLRALPRIGRGVFRTVRFISKARYLLPGFRRRRRAVA